MLRNSVPEFDRERGGVQALLEAILLETGNYRGYNDMTIQGAPQGYGLRRQYYERGTDRPTYDIELHSYACGCEPCTQRRIAQSDRIPASF